MADDSLTARAKALWELLAAAPVAFPSGPGVQVVASPGSKMCPPGWVGIVVLGDAAIATVPTEDALKPVQEALSSISVASLTQSDVLKSVLPIQAVLGPATLAYLSREHFVPTRPEVIEQVAPDDPDVQALLKEVGVGDADESGIGEITSAAFVVREEGKITAVAGYRAWPGATAHMCILTAEAARGRGLAKRAAAAAVDHALTAGLLPQWRARPEASRRVASALGFRQLGAQLSFHLRPE
ncbi:GNAT family N-acetyltransferase [Glycomyces artemisiae]|uniref:GNAT acetyltransferase-like protein n=1 Tax=Glycomyces artemisiae TaxID=1076443 RepID=A0A2T0UHE5_9ACTN|nr:GNAT family N-acetyltransferase [Glycomyces artemisiae]PRY57370.1 GNAT acetyltransferase-like protein [Glycomyces artemisiae]